jgi:hypothetical protein
VTATIKTHNQNQGHAWHDLGALTRSPNVQRSGKDKHHSRVREAKRQRNDFLPPLQLSSRSISGSSVGRELSHAQATRPSAIWTTLHPRGSLFACKLGRVLVSCERDRSRRGRRRVFLRHATRERSLRPSSKSASSANPLGRTHSFNYSRTAARIIFTSRRPCSSPPRSS